MYTVYFLYSEKDKKLYIGCTSNLKTRIIKHNNGKVSATKNRRPLILIHFEKFNDKGKAFNRERFLKSLWGAREKLKIVKNYLNKG